MEATALKATRKVSGEKKKKGRKKIGTICVFSSLFFFFVKLVSHSVWTTSVHEELCILKPKIIFFEIKECVPRSGESKNLCENAKSVLSLDYCAFSAGVTERLLFLHVDWIQESSDGLWKWGGIWSMFPRWNFITKCKVANGGAFRRLKINCISCLCFYSSFCRYPSCGFFFLTVYFPFQTFIVFFLLLSFSSSFS